MLTISHFAERCGISPSALRFYERKGLLVPARRRENGYRAYSAAQVADARFLGSLRAAGVSLKAIREFLKKDARAREAMLDTWRAEMAARLLSLQVAEQYLRGLKPAQPRVHLEQWSEPSVLWWFPTSATEGPLPFRDAVDTYKHVMERRGTPVLTRGYVRTLDFVDGRLHGEVGFRTKPGRGAPPAGARREDVPPTLFATMECGLRDDVAAHRVFRFLDELGFRPEGLHLERYLPGASDRYLLMIAVQRR